MARSDLTPSRTRSYGFKFFAATDGNVNCAAVQKTCKFTTSNSEAWEAAALYEKTYCARGEMENRIKEQLSLFADRMSTESLRANQLRLFFSSLAYLLMHALRRLALAGTEWAQAQVHTLRLRLLKIAAEVRVTARRVWVSYSNAYPWKRMFHTAWVTLRC